MTRYKGRQSATAKTLSANRLRKVLSYDPGTGKFRWRVTSGSRAVAGSIAGTRGSRGHHQIRIDGKLYQASRLAWLYMTGKWPKLEIDYINHKTSDARWTNLR
ncbi:MAG: HNH endonuclease, partial [Pseudolabrys sp.]